MIVLTAAFVIVWAVAQAVQSVKQTDIDTMCTSADPSPWVKECAKIYPASLCVKTGQLPSKTATSCVVGATYCKTNINLQDCAAADKATLYGANTPSTVYTDFAKYLENEFSCTGFCGRFCPVFLYSDCTRTGMKLDKTCDSVIFDLVKQNSVNIGVISGICALAGALVILSLFCVCFHKEFGKTEDEVKDMHKNEGDRR